MVEWIEANPLPEVCENCTDGECFNCDYAMFRWHLSKEDEAALRRKLMEQSIKRMKRKLHEGI